MKNIGTMKLAQLLRWLTDNDEIPVRDWRWLKQFIGEAVPGGGTVPNDPTVDDIERIILIARKLAAPAPTQR